MWHDIRGNQNDRKLDAGGVLKYEESRDEDDEKQERVEREETMSMQPAQRAADAVDAHAREQGEDSDRPPRERDLLSVSREIALHLRAVLLYRHRGLRGGEERRRRGEAKGKEGTMSARDQGGIRAGSRRRRGAPEAHLDRERHDARR